MRGFGLGRDQQAGSLPVDAVHDTRTPLATDAGKTVAAMVQKRIDQRAGLGPRRRMHHHPGRLVDHDQIGVLVDDVKIDLLGLGFGIDRRRHRQRERLARPDLSLLRDAVATDSTFPDQRHQARARKLKSGLPGRQRQRAVQPLPGRLIRDSQHHFISRSSHVLRPRRRGRTAADPPTACHGDDAAGRAHAGHCGDCRDHCHPAWYRRRTAGTGFDRRGDRAAARCRCFGAGDTVPTGC